jgi:hypothetical protein
VGALLQKRPHTPAKPFKKGIAKQKQDRQLKLAVFYLRKTVDIFSQV